MKKEITALKGSVDSIKTTVATLEKLLQESSVADVEVLTPALTAEKNNLLIEATLGADNAIQITEIEAQIIETSKKDSENKDSQKIQREFATTIQSRLTAENEKLANASNEYKAAVTAYLLGKLSDKETEIKQCEDLRFRKIIEADAIESIITLFDGGLHQTSCGTTDNKDRIHEMWRMRGAGCEPEFDPLEVETNKEISVFTNYLKRQGIEVI